MVKLDIKEFQLVNQILGEQVGDEVILNIAKALKANTESGYKLYARLHDDEFLVLHTYDQQEENLILKQNFRKYLYDFMANSFTYDLKIVSGHYYMTEDSCFDVAQAVEKANIAHRRAKRSGLSICVYDKEFIEATLKRKEIEGKAEKAIANCEFKVFLQAKYELENETIAGTEALVRWIDDSGKMTFPNDFIPIFEQNGFITQLDFYMFEKSCEIIHGWIVSGIRPVAVPSHLLEIELTETVVMDSKHDLSTFIADLHERGFMVSMDDFGTGYSSLGMLKSLNVDVIQCYYFSKPIAANEFTQSQPTKESVMALAIQENATKRFNLHKNNELLTDMVNSMPLAFALWDKDGNLVKFNEYLVALFGFTSEAEYIKRRKETYLKQQPDGTVSSEIFSNLFQKALEFDQQQVFMFWMRHSDGTLIPCEINLVRIINKGQHMISCYLRDMRLQVEAENIIKKEHLKLQALTDEYKLLIDHNPFCINIWRMDNSLVMCNKAVIKLFDLQNEQECISRFHELSPEYQPDGSLSSLKANEYLQKAFDMGSVTFEWMHQKLNGEKVPTEVTLNRIELNGKSAIAGFMRDLREHEKN